MEDQKEEMLALLSQLAKKELSPEEALRVWEDVVFYSNYGRPKLNEPCQSEANQLPQLCSSCLVHDRPSLLEDSTELEIRRDATDGSLFIRRCCRLLPEDRVQPIVHSSTQELANQWTAAFAAKRQINGWRKLLPLDYLSMSLKRQLCSIPVALPHEVMHINDISCESLIMLALRSGCQHLPHVAYDVLRKICARYLQDFVSALTPLLLQEAGEDCTSVTPPPLVIDVAMVNRVTYERFGFTAVGFGIQGLNHVFNDSITRVLQQIDPNLKISLVALKILNDVSSFLLLDLLQRAQRHQDPDNVTTAELHAYQSAVFRVNKAQDEKEMHVEDGDDTTCEKPKDEKIMVWMCSEAFPVDTEELWGLDSKSIQPAKLLQAEHGLQVMEVDSIAAAAKEVFSGDLRRYSLAECTKTANKFATAQGVRRRNGLAQMSGLVFQPGLIVYAVR